MQKDELDFLEFIGLINEQNFEKDFENWIQSVETAIAEGAFSPFDSLQKLSDLKTI